MAKEAKMIAYLERVTSLKNSFYTFKVRQIPREEHTKAIGLSKLASSAPVGGTRRIILVTTPKDVIESMVGSIEEGVNWFNGTSYNSDI